MGGVVSVVLSQVVSGEAESLQCVTLHTPSRPCEHAAAVRPAGEGVLRDACVAEKQLNVVGSLGNRV